MKKWMYSGILALAALFVMPEMSNAQEKEIKYLKVTVMNAKLWPAKPSGKCWDPCLGKRYKLPARGAKDFSKYFENVEFRKACTGSKSPDALVEIKIGKEVFRTDKFNNTCTPEFKTGGQYLSKEFVLTGANVPFTVKVLDNDGAAGFQVKTDEMGTYTTGSIPEALLKGQTLTLKSFGQVEELTLKGEVITRKVSAGCDGTYKVTVVSFDVHGTRANGKTWDNKWLTGGGGRPEVFVKVVTGGTTIQTKHKKNLNSGRYDANDNNSSDAVIVKKGNPLKVSVYDKDVRGNEVIGETAEADVCKIFKGAAGNHTFTNFGRVKSVTISYTKKK